METLSEVPEWDLERWERDEKRASSLLRRSALAALGAGMAFGLALAAWMTPKEGLDLRLLAADPALPEGCFKHGVLVHPPKNVGSSKTYEASPRDCQLRCASSMPCAEFSWWPDGSCILSDQKSIVRAAQHKSFGAVIGPRSCDERPVTYEVAVRTAEAPVVIGIHGRTCSAYAQCVEEGIIEGNCCPNNELVSLSCCNSSPPPVRKPIYSMGAECSAFPLCAAANMTGACCPTTSGVRLQCCPAETDF
ncbi:Apple domain-containing protein [Durusdinium trenchii]